MNRNKIYISAFLLVLGLLVFLEAQQEEPVNWNPSYAAIDKIPLGTFVLYQELDEIFSMEHVAIPPYEFLQDQVGSGTYLFINNQLHIDDAELERLLDWVATGNTAFMAAESFSDNLLDTLGLQLKVEVPREGISSKPMFNLTNPDLRGEQAFLYDRETYHFTFSNTDSTEHRILGISQLYSHSSTITDPQVSFLQVAFGDGQLLLHTAPQVFSNFFILDQENKTHIENTLAYVPKDTKIFWDAYYKAGKKFNTSPLYILLGTPSLKWAYYFALIGSLLFVLFEGKRKQRSIPILKPPKNNSLEFTRTIADLYMDQKDLKSISNKMIMFFRRTLNQQFGKESGNRRQYFKRISARSGIPEQEIKSLFSYLDTVLEKESISEDELKNVNYKIEEFKKRSHEK